MQQLSSVEPERLASAISAVLEGTTLHTARRPASLPPPDRLEEGAREVIADEVHDIDSAHFFQSLLEIGYIVASADGLSDAERGTMAAFIRGATRSVLEEDLLRQHLGTLDAAADILGRKERLHRAAQDFGDVLTQRQAMGFAVIIALADGTLADTEMSVLIELGGCFGLSEDDVGLIVADITRAVEDELSG
jgi:tellurite resistance protein